MYIGENENTEQYARNTSKLGMALVVTFLACSIASVLLIGLVMGEFDPVDLHPTYAELDRHGFYAYVVPPSMMEKYG